MTEFTAQHIVKTFEFQASHIDTGVGGLNPESHFHGHTYQVVIGLTATDADELETIQGYGDLPEIAEWIEATFNHAHIAATMAEAKLVGNLRYEVLRVAGITEVDSQKCVVIDATTSPANIAQFIFERWMNEYPEIVAVTVNEGNVVTVRYGYDPDDESIDDYDPTAIRDLFAQTDDIFDDNRVQRILMGDDPASDLPSVFVDDTGKIIDGGNMGRIDLDRTRPIKDVDFDLFESDDEQ